MKQTLKFLAIVGFLTNCIWLSALAQSVATDQLWVASWGSSQQIPEPQNVLAPDDLRDATVRQIFH
ncbi:MAG: hypothetical protein WA804_08525, partial [Terriglobales bacterium]